MPERDDDILQGQPETGTREMKDSDGDGVSDVEERFAGTNPEDASDQVRPGPVLAPGSDDPRGAPEGGPNLEKAVSIDPAANMPAGQSIATALDGATNLDGSTLSTGPNRDLGGGFDDLLTGHTGGPNPLDVQRDPTITGETSSAPPAPSTQGSFGGIGTTDGGGTAAGTISQTTAGNTAFSTPPPGAELSSRAPNWDLVSGDSADGGTKSDDFDWSHPIDSTIRLVDSSYGKDTKVDAGSGKQIEGLSKIVIKRDTEPKPYDVNPDADSGTVGAPTQEQIDHALAVHGGTTTPVQGVEAGPQIDDSRPPDRLSPVTDPIDDGDTTTVATATPTGPPDAAVIHTINTDSGFAPPPPGGDAGAGGSQGEGDLMSSQSAATAVSADDDPTGVSQVTPVGSGASGIQSVAPADDGVPDVPDDVSDGADATITPVDSFTQGYLQDASSDALAPDLSADLTQPDAVPDHVDALPMDDGVPLDTGAPLDDGFDEE